MRGYSHTLRSVCLRARTRMQFLGLAIALMIGGLSAPLGAWGQSSTPRPHAVAPEATFHFGTVAQGTKVKHEFKIRNEGSGPFHIQRVVPSCGCTASAADQATVFPGGESTVRVEFDTTGFSGDQTKTVRVLTSDSERPSIDLAVKGTILADVVAEPAYVSFGDLFVGPQGSPAKTVTVSVREGASVRLGEVKGWSKLLAVTETVKESTRRVLSIQLRDGVKPGELRDRIVVTLVTPQGEGTLNIPVVASVKSEVFVRPMSLSFGVIGGSEPIVRKATLSNLGARPLQIRSITSSHPGVVARFSPVDAAGNFILEVALDPTQITSDFKGELTIITDRQDLPPMALHVYGIVPPRL